MRAHFHFQLEIVKMQIEISYPMHELIVIGRLKEMKLNITFCCLRKSRYEKLRLTDLTVFMKADTSKILLSFIAATSIRKKREHALDQENNQKKVFSFFLVCFLVESVFTFFS